MGPRYSKRELPKNDMTPKFIKFKLNLEFQNGDIHKIDVSTLYHVKTLKQQINIEMNIPFIQQELYYQDKLLSNDESLFSELGIVDGSYSILVNIIDPSNLKVMNSSWPNQ